MPSEVLSLDIRYNAVPLTGALAPTEELGPRGMRASRHSTRKGAADCSIRGTVEWGLFRHVVATLVTGVEGLVRPTSPFADLKRAGSDVV